MSRWAAKISSNAAITGVSNVAEFATLRTGQIVLDLGCGAGLDSLIAAQRVGPTGGVIRIDYSADMLTRARGAAASLGLTNVEFILADAEQLPIPDDSIDVALVNGIFNLNPAREAVFAELARVVRPGGQVFAAELILVAPLPEGSACNATDWFA